MCPSARLTTDFRERCARTGLTGAALAAAIGISRRFFNRVKNDHEPLSVAFMAGAVHAELAATFAEVAEPVPTNTPNENASAVAPAGVKAQLKRRDKCLTRPRLSVDAQSPNTSDEL